MLTKKEKLLTFPWIQRKYQTHRRKVMSAEAAIDFQAPCGHPHVTVKLKKTQRELERMQEIERENRRLLQRLGQIMNTSRMENFWRQPRPNFLNREIMYKVRPKTSSAGLSTTDVVTRTGSTTKSNGVRGTSARCPTCSGRPVRKNQVYPEERVPWAPPKVSWNCKELDGPRRVEKCCIYCC